jgi:hypothetical protein
MHMYIHLKCDFSICILVIIFYKILEYELFF